MTLLAAAWPSVIFSGDPTRCHIAVQHMPSSTAEQLPPVIVICAGLQQQPLTEACCCQQLVHNVGMTTPGSIVKRAAGSRHTPQPPSVKCCYAHVYTCICCAIGKAAFTRSLCKPTQQLLPGLMHARNTAASTHRLLDHWHDETVGQYSAIPEPAAVGCVHQPASNALNLRLGQQLQAGNSTAVRAARQCMQM